MPHFLASSQRRILTSAVSSNTVHRVSGRQFTTALAEQYRQSAILAERCRGAAGVEPNKSYLTITLRQRR